MNQRVTRSRALGCFLATGILLSISGCGSSGSAETFNEPAAEKSSSSVETTGEMGSVGFDFTLDNANVTQATYEITGNGLDKSGDIDVSHASGVSVVVAGIPFGDRLSRHPQRAEFERAPAALQRDRDLRHDVPGRHVGQRTDDVQGGADGAGSERRSLRPRRPLRRVRDVDAAS